MGRVHTCTIAMAVIGLFISLGAYPSAAQVQVFFGDLAGFNTAAGSPPVGITFDDIAAGTDITGTTLAGVTFQLGNQPDPSAPLIVVPGLDTFTPESFEEGLIDPTTNRLFPTSGEHVLSPGGLELGPGPDPLVENDDLELIFDPPVFSVGFDILFQSIDTSTNVNLTVFGPDGEVLFSALDFPFPSPVEGGAPGGAVFVGFASHAANIARIVINDVDDDALFSDSNIGFDTFRIGREPGPVPSCQGGRSHIRGRITTAEDAAGLPEVTVTLIGPDACQETATTKALGFYLFPHLKDGTYTVTPSETDCTFDPPSRIVTLEEGGRARLNFAADCP